MVIDSVRKLRTRYVVQAGGEVFQVPGPLYRERPLQEGEELDIEEYDQWLLTRQYRPALEYAVSLLAQRPFARQELWDRLRRIGYRPAVCDMALYKLERHGLMDDTDFARRWAASRAGRKLGPHRIRQELSRKGVSREDADEALSALDEDGFLASAVQLADRALRRGKPGEDPRRRDQRVLAMLARRGYSFDLARRALLQARAGAETDDL